MKRILIKIAYDGVSYKGWQSGGSGICVEDIINKKLSKLLNEDVKIFAISRTDTGVSAMSNYATFDTNSKINPNKLFFAINNLLPKDISILESMEVPLNFNLRKIPTKKTYIYTIHNSKIRNPIKEHNAHFVHYDIDIKKMNKAKKYLIGTHDFKSFINPDANILKYLKKNNITNTEKWTTRTIYDIKIKKKNDIITITIVGNSFLYQMVRIICGSLLKVGMNMWAPKYIKEILEKKNRKYAGFTLPGKGLLLYNIEFLNKKTFLI